MLLPWRYLIWRVCPAYVDPTSGGILLQMLLGGTLSFLVICRLVRSRLSSLASRHRPSRDDDLKP